MVPLRANSLVKGLYPYSRGLLREMIREIVFEQDRVTGTELLLCPGNCQLSTADKPEGRRGGKTPATFKESCPICSAHDD